MPTQGSHCYAMSHCSQTSSVCWRAPYVTKWVVVSCFQHQSGINALSDLRVRVHSPNLLFQKEGRRSLWSAWFSCLALPRTYLVSFFTFYYFQVNIQNPEFYEDIFLYVYNQYRILIFIFLPTPSPVPLSCSSLPPYSFLSASISHISHYSFSPAFTCHLRFFLLSRSTYSRIFWIIKKNEIWHLQKNWWS